MEYYSRKDGENNELLINHLERASELAYSFGKDFNNGEICKTTTLLHDIGKATIKFQEVLDKKRIGVDHSIVGAYIISQLGKKNKLRNLLAYIIAAHHSELDMTQSIEIPNDIKLNDYDFSRKFYTKNNKECALGSKREFIEIIEYAKKHNLIRKIEKKDYFPLKEMTPNETMFYMRMIFSCLVDADYSSSAEFSNENYIEESTGVELNPKDLYDKLIKYKNNIIKNSKSNSKLNELRNLVFDNCVEIGKNPTNIYTLTAPTGTAKTLALLAFALQNAIKTNKKRIIIVLPYLSIINQNVDIYKTICGDNIVLEDDSNVEYTETTKLLADRWSSPITITTSVKFFETLFSSKPTTCRKLHNLSNAVIVFDESHTLNSNVLTCTIELINEFAKRYNSTILFSTATPLNYSHRKNIKWTPIEVIKDVNKLYYDFSKTKNIDIKWELDKEKTYEELCNEVKTNTTLHIFNTKKLALKMYKEMVKHFNMDSCFLLTNNLCPQHKEDVLKKIKEKLDNKQECHIISTQCIEAGVDIDIKEVYRQIAPLNSIIQAAGRCGRNCNEDCFLIIFNIKDDEIKQKYPNIEYQNAVLCLKILLNKYNGSIDINNLEIMNEYSKLLFNSSTSSKDKFELTTAIKEYDFVKVNQEYNLIENNTKSIIVPYFDMIDEYKKIKQEIIENNYCINKTIMKKSKRIVINSYDKIETISKYCTQLKTRINGEEYLLDWFILDDTFSLYDEKIGLDFDNDFSLQI